MRERTAAIGGTLQAGPRPEGGFRVRREAAAVIRVVLADDQALVRAGFRALLDAQADISVVGEAGDGAEAVALAAELRARRRADGHPDAGGRRARGDAADRLRRRR